MLYPVNLIVSIALALLLLLGGFGAGKRGGTMWARSLDINLPEPLSVTYGDSHGGFHGDGLLHIELTFDSEDRAAVGGGRLQPPQRGTGIPSPWMNSWRRWSTATVPTR